MAIFDTVLDKIIGFILVFSVVGALAGTLILASNNISNCAVNQTCLPLVSLFASGGALFVIFMVILFKNMVKGSKK